MGVFPLPPSPRGCLDFRIETGLLVSLDKPDAQLYWNMTAKINIEYND